MRYFKATITYEIISGDGAAPPVSHVLYCCAPREFPKQEELKELFYSLHENDKKFIAAEWREVREEDLPSEGAHLL